MLIFLEIVEIIGNFCNYIGWSFIVYGYENKRGLEKDRKMIDIRIVRVER